ncbi:MAG: hypothetical protein LC624_00045 [Halobacteriales archaeon]|nr:hypothetical protein [Halobacteriales archaeon]
MLGLDAALLLWVGVAALTIGPVRPSLVDVLLWVLLAVMTVVAWWPLPAHRRAEAQPASL